MKRLLLLFFLLALSTGITFGNEYVMENGIAEVSNNFGILFNNDTLGEAFEKIEVLNATFDYTPSEYCQGDANPIPNVVTSGGMFTSTSGLIFINTTTGEIDLGASTPGTYSVTYTVASGSPLTFMQNVTIHSSQSASITYNSSGMETTTLCRSSSNPSPIITGLTGGEFTSSPDGLVFVSGGGGSEFIVKPAEGKMMSMSSTGEIDLGASAAGEYVIEYTTPEGCSVSTHTVTLVDTLDPDFVYEFASYCSDDINPVVPVLNQLLPETSNDIFLTASGIDIDAFTGVINPSSSTPGTYFVRRTILGNCSGGTLTSNFFTITIVSNGNPSFSYDSASFCKTDTNPIATISGTAGGTFTSSNVNLVFADTGTGEIDLAATPVGTYPIVYELAGICAATSAPQNITITGANASFSYVATDYCSGDADPSPAITGTTGGAFSNSSSSGLSIDPASGVIDLDASTAGTHEIAYTITGACTVSSTFTITIVTSTIADFNYSSTTYCESDSNPTPNITGTGGGTFSSATGLVFVSASTGEIDLTVSTPGMYTIDYVISDPCGVTVQRDIIINSENPTLSFETSIDDATYIPNPAAAIDIEVDRRLELRLPESFNGTVSWSGPNSFSATGTEVLVSNSIQMADAGTYTANVTFDVTCGAAPTTYNFVVNVINNVVRVSPKVFLQGAMLGTTDDFMRDDLRTLDYLPNDTPYSDGVSVDGTIFDAAALDQDNIVDWVFVELRDAVTNTIVVDAQSAFVQRDGDIVDINGNLELTMTATTGGNYYIVVKHRNHLGIMTATPITLNTITTVLDFRDGSQATFGGVNAQTLFGMPVGTIGMWAGDANSNNNTRLLGSDDDENFVKSMILGNSGNFFNSLTYTYSEYDNSDINLDGTVVFLGTNDDVSVVKNNILNHPSNFFNSFTYTILKLFP